ncbi:MAG: nitroreductase family protein [Actinobacteria bacterium]|nr:nitroreductase family protein [Actinomycetota bacterium]
MDAIEAIRTRRTVKAFAPEPPSREQLAELLELARWAPNHKLTCPWRFRVLGPQSLEALKQVAAAQAAREAPAGADPEVVGAAAAAKLDRAPALVVASVVCGAEPPLDAEDEHAAAIAAYIVLLGAHAVGLAGYWRSPAVLRDAEGLAALDVPEGERVLGLLHLGRAAQALGPAPSRTPADEYVYWLD